MISVTVERRYKDRDGDVGHKEGWEGRALSRRSETRR